MARDDRDDTVMSEADEEAIRAKLREAGWDKNKILSKSKATTVTATAKETATKDETPTKSSGKASNDKTDRKKSSSARDKDRERDRERDRDREGRSGRGERRRSRSARRRDKDRGGDRGERRRERDRDRDRERGSRRRRSSRSRSVSKSRSRSRSASVRGSNRREKDRGGRERSSRADKRRSRSVSASRSRSRSLSKSRGSSKRSRRGDVKGESSPKKDVKKTEKADTTTEDKPTGEEKTNSENGAKEAKVGAPESSVADTKKANMAEEDSKKDSDDRKSRKSSRHHSRSTSRSPSRARHRRRRHRSASRSRSASRGRRGRGSSRSRSRSHSRRRRSSRRRSSRSRSRSYSRRHRSKSRDRSRRDANSSPQPHQFPPAEAAAPAVLNPLNPSITQLMQQYPTMSLQDIIAKMQASNVTMAAAVSMKPARELYVGNLPASVTGPQLQEFLGTIIQQVGLTVQPGNPILSTWISTDGHFAFCEMRSIEECNMALMLNQLPLLGQPLKFGRPKSFMGPPQPMPVLPPRTQTALSNLGCTPNTAWFASPAIDVSSVAAMTASLTSATLQTPIAAPFLTPTPAPIVALPAETSSNKLIMSNIPVVLTEDQVKELVEPFGELKSFELLKDPSTHQSTGSALFEYVDENVTDSAKDGLDGLDLGGIPLAVRRAMASEETGPVLRMANMVSIDELKDDEEFADLKEDVEEECKRFGNVVALEIPRSKDDETVAGLGDIFVQFETSNEAAAALKALSGRKFGGNIVKVSYFPLAKLQQKDFA